MTTEVSECSVLICGFPSGKTCLIQRYLGMDFNSEHIETQVPYDQIQKQVEFDGRQVKLYLCDTHMDHVLGGLSISPLMNQDSYILVYDITDKESFEETKYFLEEIKNCATKKTLPILVGNKVDMESNRVVNKRDAQNFAKDQNIPYIETSAKDGTNVNELFNLVLSNVLTPSEDVKKRIWDPYQLDTTDNRVDPKGCNCTVS